MWNTTGVAGCAQRVLDSRVKVHLTYCTIGVLFPAMQWIHPKLVILVFPTHAGTSAWNSSLLFPSSLLFHCRSAHVSSSPGSSLPWTPWSWAVSLLLFHGILYKSCCVICRHHLLNAYYMPVMVPSTLHINISFHPYHHPQQYYLHFVGKKTKGQRASSLTTGKRQSWDLLPVPCPSPCSCPMV